MALKHILLGVIAALGPQTGYVLHKSIFRPGRPTLPQVYQSLRTMKEENLIDDTRVHSEKGPSKNVCSLTPLGRAELERWLRESEDVVSVWREPIMNKVWFGNLIEKEAIINDLKYFIDIRRASMEYYEQKRERLIRHSSKRKQNTMHKLYSSLVFDLAISRSKTDIEWAEIVVQKLSSVSTDGLKIGNGGTK
ncbi:PadR family transcriptional regulator [Chloroflexota bacterium]